MVGVLGGNELYPSSPSPSGGGGILLLNILLLGMLIPPMSSRLPDFHTVKDTKNAF
jgi:hypothetical protein